ncbi:hypothetical protein JCM4814A_09020 [Streptomyces phaeofaciens JCM 4814]|uniref:Uncharacterized protein n=1 Tax=Streptomyces phaeofaciens TaxID=68254 RepID=A0A918HPJ0_9ACTN|nr:hypothetical protein [Streptomyces phaeofaciens]GGT90976.1 hypothetical protein GCM10010226_81350 [Streptomyces phaeofaciens]
MNTPLPVPGPPPVPDPRTRDTALDPAGTHTPRPAAGTPLSEPIERATGAGRDAGRVGAAPTTEPDRDRVPEERLARLWKDHRRAPYPDGFRGVNIGGVELILLDADVAGLVRSELDGGLGGAGIAGLWACIADLDTALPLIDEPYCLDYFTRLRTMARLAAARHLPTAT